MRLWSDQSRKFTKVQVGRDFAKSAMYVPGTRRSATVGFPATQRTFMGRNFGSYQRIEYELWDAGIQQPSHPSFNLETMIKAYDAEAVQLLNVVLNTMVAKWP
jgi:hypothetical protein